MKTLLTIVAAIFAASFSAQADSKVFGDWKPITPSTLKAAQECHTGGASVAMTCKDCKSVNTGADKKFLASMFKEGATHGCSGCKGIVTVKSSKAGRDKTAEYTHECSKCAKESATCASHPKS